MNNLFSYFTSTSAPVYFPGAPFVLSAVLAVVSMFLARRGLRRSQPVPQPTSAG